MAGVSYLIGSDQLAQQRKGYIAISLTNPDSSVLASEIALGSRLEIAGGMVGFEADESMGAGWAALPAGIVYARIDSVNLTSEYTTVAPVWNTELQGWYDATGQYRYYAKLVKSAGGDYTQKALYINSRSLMITYIGEALNTGADGDHEIRVASDARALWDESEDWWDFDKSIKCKRISVQYYHGTYTRNEIFDKISPYIPNTGDKILISGANYDGIGNLIFSYAERINANDIYLYGYKIDAHTPSYEFIRNGLATTLEISIAW